MKTITHAQLRALRAHQQKQADALPQDANMWAFMATGAFDPPMFDDFVCDPAETSSAIADALRTINGGRAVR